MSPNLKCSTLKLRLVYLNLGLIHVSQKQHIVRTAPPVRRGVSFTWRQASILQIAPGIARIGEAVNYKNGTNFDQIHCAKSLWFPLKKAVNQAPADPPIENSPKLHAVSRFIALLFIFRVSYLCLVSRFRARHVYMESGNENRGPWSNIATIVSADSTVITHFFGGEELY